MDRCTCCTVITLARDFLKRGPRGKMQKIPDARKTPDTYAMQPNHNRKRHSAFSNIKTAMTLTLK